MVMLRNTLGMMLIFASLLMALAVVSKEYGQSCGIPVFCRIDVRDRKSYIEAMAKKFSCDTNSTTVAS